MIRYFLIWAISTGALWLLFAYLREAPRSHFKLFIQCAAFSTAAAALLAAVVFLF